jgi:27-O-demethylrifamycin SV methyltransferase
MPGRQTLQDASQIPPASTSPVVVYDQVTRAWELLLGEDLHFGLFNHPENALPIATAKLTRHLAERAQLRSGRKVLDAGCGIGGPACFLAQEIGCRVTGISTSRVGIQIATARAAAQGLGSSAEFLVRDAMANELPPASFDCAWVMESSHLMERKDSLFAECTRVLQPGGRLILCDIIVRKTIPFHYLVRNLAEFENLNGVFGKQHVEPLETYVQAAEKVRLTILGTQDVSEAVLPTLDHWTRNAEQHRDEVAQLAGEPYVAQFTRACAFLQQLWKEGWLGYGVFLAERAE